MSDHKGQFSDRPGHAVRQTTAAIPNAGSATPSPAFEDVPAMLRAYRPERPVYCIYPEALRGRVRSFIDGFPGRVLYAVKANDEPQLVRLIHESGVRHFDCASLPEIELVDRECPGATSYFMIPARLRGAAREAHRAHGVRHFMLDHASGLDALASEVPLQECVVFVRMAVSHPAASLDLSAKFGAPPAEVPGLLQAVSGRGAEAALAFNVGSGVRDPDAYRHALEVATGVLRSLPVQLRLVDIGGGFPHRYPGFEVPSLEAFFQAVRSAHMGQWLAAEGELLCEPGRALVAPGVSAIVEVLLRKDDRLYLNDGMYGAFWELRFKMQDRFPVRAFRDGTPLTGPDTLPFRLYGPTCDSSDMLPGRVSLPAGVRAGDHLEFGQLGAYSLAGRTRFNGHYSDTIVRIEGADARPPGGA